jgi:hypothetical protein
MAFSYRVLESKVNGSNLSSYDSDDVSAWTLAPAANRVIVVSANSQRDTAGEPNSPTISGLGLSWTAIDNDVWYDTSSAGAKGAAWWAATGGTPPSSGTYTVDYGGQDQERWESEVIEVSSADLAAFIAGAGTRKAQATGTSTSPSASVGAGPTAGNAIMGICFFDARDSETFSAGTGFTEISESGFAVAERHAFEWDTTPADDTADGTLSASADWGMLVFEIAAGGTVATPGLGSLSVAGFAPTPTVTTEGSVNVAVGSVTATGKVPSAYESTEAPAAPTNTAGTANGDSIAATYTDNTSGANQHRAYIKKATDSIWSFVAELDTAETAYTFEYLLENTAYDIGFTSFNAAAESPMDTVEVSTATVIRVSGVHV